MPLHRGAGRGKLAAWFVLPAAFLGAGLCGGREQPAPVKEAAAPPQFEKEIRPLLQAHCIKCHGPEKQKGKVDLSIFNDQKAAQRQRKLWQRVGEQVRMLEMPPEDQPQLSEEHRQLLLRWVERTVATVDCSDPSERDPGRSVLRRLNRSEYRRTLRDLLGLEFDAASAVGIPDDPSSGGFDNVADALNLSPVLMEKYFTAADTLLDRLFPPGKEVPKNNLPQDVRKAQTALLFVTPGKDLTKREAAHKVLERLARRAYRRPVEAAEVERLLKLFDLADSRGERFEEALRLPLKAVLVSPHFLFRIERDQAPEGSTAMYRVGDYELATRLSYFLWSSMPDEELFTLAGQKQLSDPAVLEKQVRRMLADPRAHALTENFAGQWLQLRKLGEARPSTEFFPTFTDQVRRAMHDETATFFDRLREEDRSLLELLDADYTYLNEDLAKHYGIAGVKGPKMQRVQLQPGDHRGGLLGMGSVLAMTSHTSRTSPTLRGKWILEVIFGTPPPPPPPDAGQIDEKQEKGKAPKSFRELLSMHATHPTCAGCHKKMDPLGFALDSYDAVGRWRDSHGGQPLDTSAQLPGGEKFNGPVELKRLIAGRKDQFMRNLTEQMFVYALGRELQTLDECAIREVLAALQQDNNRFSTLVLGIVRSVPFQHRKNLDAK